MLTGELIIAALGLGLAGLDPAGALIAIAALTAGAHTRAVLLYALVAVMGTVVLGTVLSLTLGGRLAEFDWLVLIPAGRGGAILEIALGVVLLAWAVLRLVKREVRAPKPRQGRRGSAGLVAAGALFALSAVLDPTFVAMVVLAGRGQGPVSVTLAHLLWALLSQAPLVVVAVAIVTGRHQRVVERFGAWWRRAQPVVRHVVTVVLLLVALVLVTDGTWWFATGDFLLPAP